MIPPSRHSSKFRRKPHPGIADLVVPRSLGRVSAKLASGKQSEKKQRCHCMCLFQMSVVRLQILKSGITVASDRGISRGLAKFSVAAGGLTLRSMPFQ